MAKGKLPAALKKFQKTPTQMARMGKGGSKAKPKAATVAKSKAIATKKAKATKPKATRTKKKH